jgi:hypothetical protein
VSDTDGADIQDYRPYRALGGPTAVQELGNGHSSNSGFALRLVLYAGSLGCVLLAGCGGEERSIGSRATSDVKGPPGITLASPEISAQSGARVMASPWLSASQTGGANVRDAALDSVLFLQDGGVHGTVVGGPVYATAGNCTGSGCTGNWWQVEWDAEPVDQNNVEGWSADSFLALAPTEGDVPEPDFSSTYYDSNINIFWESGDAPNKTPNNLGNL